MKKRMFIYSVASLVGLWLCFSPQFVYTNLSSPPAGHTGAPGEPTCAKSGCHTGNSVIFDATRISFNTVGSANISSGYDPGTVYNFVLSFQGIFYARYGFQVTALDQNNNAAGSFTITNPTTTSITSSGGRDYVGHLNASSNSAYTFRWTAPSTDIGPITFYFTANGADGDGTTAGNFIHQGQAVATTSSFTRVTPTGIKVINADEIAGINIFPNPFRETLNVEFTGLDEEKMKIQLFDNSGKLILEKDENTVGIFEKTQFDTKNLAAGVYFLKMTAGENIYYKKVVAK